MRGEGEGGRFPPLDRLDLIENGRLLAGIDARVGLKGPTAEELLISGAEFALDFLAGLPSGSTSTPSRLGSMRPATGDAIAEIGDPSLLLARGVRRVTKLVLFPVRFMFTAATGRVGTNEEAVRWYLTAAGAPAKSLVSDALAWRAAAWRDPSAAAALLREQLVPLYLQYDDDHIERLAAAGERELARGFEQWRCRLTRDAGPRSAANPDTA